MTVLNDEISKENAGYKYLLCVIDVFSKMALVKELKAKTPESVLVGFKHILRMAKDRRPENGQSDNGREFDNRKFKEFVNIKLKAHFYTSRNPDIKCAIVESFQRTLKNEMWRYFTRKKTRKYRSILQSLVRGYNSSYHSTIRCAPKMVRAGNALDEVAVLDFMEAKQKFK